MNVSVRDPPVAADPLEEALAGEELHDQVEQPLLAPPEVGDLDDVVVVERAGDLGLAPEPLDEVRGQGELGPEHLHRHVLAQVDVARAEHRPHAARGEVGGEDVAAVERRPDKRDRLEGRDRVCELGHRGGFYRGPRAARG